MHIGIYFHNVKRKHWFRKTCNLNVFELRINSEDGTNLVWQLATQMSYTMKLGLNGIT